MLIPPLTLHVATFPSLPPTLPSLSRPSVIPKLALSRQDGEPTPLTPPLANRDASLAFRRGWEQEHFWSPCSDEYHLRGERVRKGVQSGFERSLFTFWTSNKKSSLERPSFPFWKSNQNESNKSLRKKEWEEWRRDKKRDKWRMKNCFIKREGSDLWPAYMRSFQGDLES